MAVIGKPEQGRSYVFESASNNEIQGGNVIIYVQVIDAFQPNTSWVLECKQITSPSPTQIPQNTLLSPQISYVKDGTGDANFLATIPQGEHICVGRSQGFGMIINITQNNSTSSFRSGNKIEICGGVKNIHIQGEDGEWQFECTAIEDKRIEVDTYTISGTGNALFYISTLKDNYACDIASKGSVYANLQSAPNRSIIFSNNFLRHVGKVDVGKWKTKVVANTEDAEWTLRCVYPFRGLEGTDLDAVHITPLVFSEEPKTTSSLSNTSSQLVRNVVSKADGTECANHLLGTDQYVGDAMLIPPDLCIQFVERTDVIYRGRYYADTNRIVMVLHPKLRAEKAQYQYTLLHEICHAQQDYYLNNINVDLFAWEQKQAGKQFEGAAGYQVQDGSLTYPRTGQYYGMYGTRNIRPLELSAEMCTHFLSPDIANQADRYSQETRDRIFNNAVLQGWVYQYMLNTNLAPSF